MKTYYGTHRSITNHAVAGAIAALALFIAGCDAGPDSSTDRTDIDYPEATTDSPSGEYSQNQTNYQNSDQPSAATRENTEINPEEADLLKKRVEEKLMADNGNGEPTLTTQEMQKIAIQVNDDTVILTGIVDNEQTKQEVEKQAEEVPGVSNVKNQLQIASR